jgi:hypothetical protein
VRSSGPVAAPLSRGGDSELHDLSLDHINDEALPPPQPQPPRNARLTTSATVDFERNLGLDSDVHEEVKNESSKNFDKIFFLGCFGLNGGKLLIVPITFTCDSFRPQVTRVIYMSGACYKETWLPPYENSLIPFTGRRY